ncbi:kinase-like domain-containing protein [Paraphoma chrysanthemicola]|uniref:Kinase-like domain-containing protein n=1 Tax=Paraphoma chrysanthemicola TaxID=798071 RepID=A0A8K0R5V8_9PLEO|nr:kinase-like domain-containing protein [Paraphoma chrysanthemicola]
MIEANSLPELVRSTRLEASISGHITTHTRQTGDHGLPQREEWHQLRELGYGGSGAFRDLFVEFYGWYRDQNWLYISMEYCEHLDLGTYLKEHNRLLEAHIQSIARQVLTALSYMHECGFAHRDLKPPNILIKSKPPEDWCVKLCDLGLSRRSVDASGITTVHGTFHFMAPEFRGRLTDESPSQAADFAADIWSAGETLSRMMTGEETFTSVALDRFQRGLQEFPRERFFNLGFSNAAVDFVRSLMKASPEKRPTVTQALEHPWLSWSLQKDLQATRSKDPAVHQIDEEPISSQIARGESVQNSYPVWLLVTDQLAFTSDCAEVSSMRPLLDHHDTIEAIRTSGPRTQGPPHLSSPSLWTDLGVFRALYVSLTEATWGMYKTSWARRFMLAYCVAYFCVILGVFTAIIWSETSGLDSFIEILCLSGIVLVMMSIGSAIFKVEKAFSVS